eukprot:CAMPEP_0172458662 /NCGR_PEP_ID=MMETSP1065-20121228/28617_1 /TAXON_ID=265537 /ORGANISM="Amphiprora paludosa, Strain CCMP125" /LENGTH=381 /DNA_ID=CAMNT_0013213021 /DNA_START=265 /DNA_END=1410 /DNA_ORIENTATION=-
MYAFSAKAKDNCFHPSLRSRASAVKSTMSSCQSSRQTSSCGSYEQMESPDEDLLDLVIQLAENSDDEDGDLFLPIEEITTQEISCVKTSFDADGSFSTLATGDLEHDNTVLDNEDEDKEAAAANKNPEETVAKDSILPRQAALMKTRRVPAHEASRRPHSFRVRRGSMGARSSSFSSRSDHSASSKEKKPEDKKESSSGVSSSRKNKVNSLRTPKRSLGPRSMSFSHTRTAGDFGGKKLLQEVPEGKDLKSSSPQDEKPVSTKGSRRPAPTRSMGPRSVSFAHRHDLESNHEEGQSSKKTRTKTLGARSASFSHRSTCSTKKAPRSGKRQSASSRTRKESTSDNSSTTSNTTGKSFLQISEDGSVLSSWKEVSTPQTPVSQ